MHKQNEDPVRIDPDRLLVRLSPQEVLLINHYRSCDPERQDVLLYFSEELKKHTREETKNMGNVILLLRK